ncbi:MAG TPA: GAF domain-containing protein, partial [Spirochaetes bacterium]|nr:GAF domain-containing protein [Spirochaetota bacterium]
IQISKILADIHKHKIMHKDINPSNVVWNKTKNQVKIIDFGISTHLAWENPEILNPDRMEGTLQYMSPEQTGRMNRSIDYRTDLYSLGVTFYEMLSGETPFQVKDPIELIHCHIAKNPLEVHNLRHDVPISISAIISKLVCKTAEERYQSALGLLTDLKHCLEELNRDGQIADFVPGRKDISERFEIPRKLYGREQELNTLFYSFDSVRKGNTEFILTSGSSGIGKSSLIHEIHKPIAESGGYFITGAFDQYKGNIPYDPMIQAFRQFLHRILSESYDHVTRWKNRILDDLGENAQIILNVIPELEWLIGKQNPVAKLSPSEEQNRFRHVFLKFIQIFASEDHPLILFLDDLQWADLATLSLLKELVTDPDSKYLFIIGAYRDNEVSEDHSLTITLNDIRKHRADQGIKSPLKHIFLGPLKSGSIRDILRDTLHSDSEDLDRLAALVANKTHGNPFFLTQFLRTLYEKGFITFDVDKSLWTWDLKKILDQDFTENVIHLMIDKIQELTEEAQTVLKLASCIGKTFDLKTLSIIYGKDIVGTARDLREVLFSQLILPIGDGYKYVANNEGTNTTAHLLFYKFIHDHVRQAAYSLIEESTKNKVHLNIGRLLLNNLYTKDKRLFSLMNHLNAGKDLITDGDERLRMAELNLKAGLQAKASTAYDSALKYLNIGIHFLPEDCWAHHYDLTLGLYSGGAESACLCHHYPQMEALIETAIKHSNSLLDQVRFFNIRVQAYISQHKMAEAVNTTLKISKDLGVTIPTKPSRLDILISFLKTKWTLRGQSVDDLETLPDMTDPHLLVLIDIYITTGSAIYYTVPEILPYMIFKSIVLSNRHGHSHLSSYVYASYGFILCGALGNIDLGYRFAQLALYLKDKYNAKEFTAKINLLVNVFAIHWKDHLKDTIYPLLEGFQAGAETGDLEYACNCAHNYCLNLFLSSKELSFVESEMEKYNKFIHKFKQEKNLCVGQLQRQLVLNLLDRCDNPLRLVGDSFNEDLTLPTLLSANDKNMLGYLYYHKMMICYLFEDYDAAYENCMALQDYIDSLMGLNLVPLCYFYYSLILLALYPKSTKGQQRRFLKIVRLNQKKMKNWANHAPMNHLHKYYLVEAERARIFSKNDQAIDYYDRSIELARENEYLCEEALANELAAKYWLNRGKENFLGLYIKKAYYTYRMWGAKSKIKHLKSRYPHHLNSLFERRNRDKTSPETTNQTITSTTHSKLLDLDSLIQSTENALTGNKSSDLLTNLLRIAVENAGAQKGYILLDKNGRLYLEAESSGTDSVRMVQSLPVDEIKDISTAIINYVSRTHTDVVLNNTGQANPFDHDPYLTRNRAKSILCLAMGDEDKFLGLIYLENQLTTEAFSSNRLGVMRLLTRFTAGAIERAVLIQQVNEKLQELMVKEQESFRMKDEITSNIVHELRAPLTSLLMGIDFLHENLKELSLDDVHTRLEGMSHGGQTLIRTLNQLLDFSRLEANRYPCELRRIDLKPILDNIKRIYEPMCESKGIRLNISETSNMTIENDPVHMDQILNNLVANAYHYCDHNDILVDIEQDRGWLNITVSDTDIGTNRQKFNLIFEHFTHKTLEDHKSSAARIGLHMVNSLTERHGGKVTVQNSRGEGSAFRITLPIESQWTQAL